MSYATIARKPLLRRYLSAQLLSSLGDSALWLTCGIWVQQLSGSNAAAGLTYFFFLVPAVLAPVAGLVADRFPRTRLLAALNGVGVLTVLPLLLVEDSSDIWLIYTVMAANGMLVIFTGPAQSSLLVDLSPGELLGSMNGLLRTGQESLRLLAPVAGAGLYVVVGPHSVVLLDAFTFAAAAVVICTLPKVTPSTAAAETDPPKTSLWRRLGSGVELLFSDRTLTRVVVACALFMAVAGFGESARFAIVTVGLDQPSASVGLLQLLMGIGAVVCGLGAGPAIARTDAVRVLTGALALFGMGTLLTATAWPPAIYIGAMLAGGGGSTLVVSALTTLQQVAQPDQQGTAYAGFEVMTTLPQVLSVAVGAGLIATVDYRIVLALIAGGSLVAGAVAWRAAPIRFADPEVQTHGAMPDSGATRTPGHQGVGG